MHSPFQPPTPQQSSSQSGSHVIWGTTIEFKDVLKKFKHLLSSWEDSSTHQPKYFPQIHSAIHLGTFIIDVDAEDLFSYDRNLYYQAINYPQDIVPIFDFAVHDLALEHSLNEQVEFYQKPQVRLFNLKHVTNPRSLDPTDIDKLVMIRGMITRVPQLIPDLREAFFSCSNQNCKHTFSVEVNRGMIEEPEKCPSCSTKSSLFMVHNRSRFADKQIVKLQETPDSLPEGQTPATINLALYDSLVDTVQPGDRVDITGIYRAVPIRPNPFRRTISTLYRTYIDVVHVQKSSAVRLNLVDPESGESSNLHSSLSEDEIQEIMKLGKRKDIYSLLSRSLAPSIWEMQDVKKGILLQLFGGTTKSIGEKSGRFRGEINILLCGDPGTSKSQLLQFVHRIAPRGIYTSGKGSSAVGLTASVVRDPETRELVLESGALVLSDRGICCIDEFDKMSDQTRSVLHEVMEQQTISVAKAGIICSLNARTSILASANPRDSRYNPRLSVVENIQLGPTLLSRFDLIYLILDTPDARKDRLLAQHLLGIFYADTDTTQPMDIAPDDDSAAADSRYGSHTDINSSPATIGTPSSPVGNSTPKTPLTPGTFDDESLGSLIPPNPSILPLHKFTQYISWAKSNIHPKISDEAREALINHYVSMRKSSAPTTASRQKTVSATPRQLDSLIRLSEAHARVRLSPLVQLQDVDEAVRLVNAALKQVATNPETGVIDIDAILSGTTTAMRERLRLLANAVRDFIIAHYTQTRQPPLLRFNSLLVEMRSRATMNVSATELRQALELLQDDGVVSIRGSFQVPNPIITWVNE